MSVDRTPHLSDERLLLLMDGELQLRHARAATDHLRECGTCRARFEQFEASVAEFGRVYRLDRDANNVEDVNDASHRRTDSTTRSRDALKAQLAQINGGHRGPSWVSAGAMLVAALFALEFLADRSGPARPDGLAIGRQSAVRPVSYLTPGATRPVAVADLCARRGGMPRAIPARVREAVARDYSMDDLPARDYELDYLITPELGGSDDRQNLWPERYASVLWNAHVKDELEQLLPTLVCAGKLPLATAQRDLAADWIAAYKKYFHTDRPLHTYSSAALPDADDDRPSGATPKIGPRGMPTLRYAYEDN
jgi:hypothetical protein